MSNIAYIPGDGIGEEVTSQGIKVLEYLDGAYNLGLKFEKFDLGAERYLTVSYTHLTLPTIYSV